MLQVNFIMICLIHKVLMLFKITLKFKTPFKEYNILLFFKSYLIFSTTYNYGKSKA